MNGAFYIGATGLDAQQRALDVVANNIANINTSGYKRAEARFSELVAPSQPQAAGELDLSPNLNATAALAGVSVDVSPRIFAQGDMQQTGQPMDLAISGAGFIELMGPGGQTMLWRGGTLKISSDGFLAADNGMPLKARISVPAGVSALAIGADGKVQAQTASDGTVVDIGQIEVVTPKDLAQVSPTGQGLYTVPADSDLVASVPGDDGAGTLVQGSLESSNVQLADEMVTMLLLQRAYAANAQVVQAGDQLMSVANSLKR